MTQARNIAAVQMDIKISDPESNIANMIESAIALARQDVFLAAFPECALTGYCFESKQEAIENSVDLNDSCLEQLSAVAIEHKINLVFGFLEIDGNNVFNAAALFTRAGKRHIYRKAHLPRLGVDNFTTPSCDKFSVVDVEDVKIGLNICYDCSFPEPSRVLALAGADLIVLPTNWPPGALSTAECIPNARALENHVYFLAVNRVGEERGFEFIGKSKICHPNGHDLAYANHADPDVLIAEFDPSVSRNKHLVRVPGKHEIHRFDDRRPELYNDISE